jgi:8-amino-7-oxononanoate synthase
LVEEAENFIAGFHDAEAGLLFNSGYDANLGLLSSIPQRGDTIVYDQLCHASIRDGIRLSFAQSHSFIHNDINDLKEKLSHAAGNMFVVTETVFSMDGHIAPLQEIIGICKAYNANLIIDEAHATGVLGEHGQGLAQHLALHPACFARMHSFGKALGCHGAIVLGSEVLRDYLINFSRPFIYTTAMPAENVAAVRKSYEIFPPMRKERDHLSNLIAIFQRELLDSNLSAIKDKVMSGPTPIQAFVVPGNDLVKKLSNQLSEKGFDIRPILYPTVPKGNERLRIVLHSFNTNDQLRELIDLLKNAEVLIH